MINLTPLHELTKPKNSARGRLGWVTNYVSYALLFIKEGELPLQIAARRGQYPSKKIIFKLNCETYKKESSAKNEGE